MEKREWEYLFDVRTPEEYSEGHIEGSINLPLHELKKIGSVIPESRNALFMFTAVSRARAALGSAYGAYGLLGCDGYGRSAGAKVKLVR